MDAITKERTTTITRPDEIEMLINLGKGHACYTCMMECNFYSQGFDCNKCKLNPDN